MGRKRNLVLYLDKELVEKSKELGFNLSKTFENYLKHLVMQFSTVNSVNNFDSEAKIGYWCGRRDLNPGSQAWKACVLNQTRRRPPLAQNSFRNTKSYRFNINNADKRRTKTKHSQREKRESRFQNLTANTIL